MEAFLIANWIWLLGYAINLLTAIWLFRKELPYLQKILWSLPLLVPYLGPLFIGLTFNPPPPHESAEGPTDDSTTGPYGGLDSQT